MAKTYGIAESVDYIAQNLIPQYHPELATARMKYVFIDKASMKNGKPVHGKARKASGVVEFLVESDFIVEVALDQWNSMTDGQRTALVDHLLECCTGEEDEDNGDMKWVIREPEIREFTTVLRRQGAWHEDLVNFVSVAKQINIEELIGDLAQETVSVTN